MAIVRLNEAMRKKILDRLMSRGFDKEGEALLKDEHAFGEKVYADVYPADVVRKMKALPSGYMPTAGVLLVSFAGQCSQVVFGEYKMVASCHNEYNRPAKLYEANHEFTVAHLSLESRNRELRSRRETARKMGQGLLDSCSSIKQLVEIWPAAAEVVGDMTSPTQVVALTVSVPELNVRFGFAKGKTDDKPVDPKILRKFRKNSLYGKFGGSSVATP